MLSRLRIGLSREICFRMATTFLNTVKCWRFKRKMDKEKQFHTPKKLKSKKDRRCCKMLQQGSDNQAFLKCAPGKFAL